MKDNSKTSRLTATELPQDTNKGVVKVLSEDTCFAYWNHNGREEQKTGKHNNKDEICIQQWIKGRCFCIKLKNIKNMIEDEDYWFEFQLWEKKTIILKLF